MATQPPHSFAACLASSRLYYRIHSSSSLGSLVVTKPYSYLLPAGGAGYDWARILPGSNSVAVLGVCGPFLVSDCGLFQGTKKARHNLSLARHAANKYEGWVEIVKPHTLSHEPMGLPSIEG